MDTYYTYLSYEEHDFGRMYIGYRKCPKGKTPETDPYMGSYSDKTFKPTAKFILGRYGSREEAMRAEIKFHEDNDVAKDLRFANKARSLSTGFSFNRKGEKMSNEARGKMSMSRMGSKNPRYTPKDWYHPDYGEIFQVSVSELMRIYPYQGLHQSFLSLVSNEIRLRHRGWRLLKNKNVVDRSKKNINHDWYHREHGEVLQKSISDIVKDYPNEKYSPSGLCSVANGGVFRYRGWILLKNKDAKVRPKKNIPRNWYHPLYGKFIGKSAPDLIKMFPEQNLTRSGLHRVATGKAFRHKGWTKAEEP